jgi:glycosyltransferase involved in cell wall biosynthesis
MDKLSIIVPFVNEYPQNIFTLQALAQECAPLGDRFEILAVDNFCAQVSDQREKALGGIATELKLPPDHVRAVLDKWEQPFNPDKGGDAVKAADRLNPWLKYVRYGDKLSHWNAKNYAVSKSTGDVLLFVDAHVIPSHGSIVSMFHFYSNNRKALNGSLHLPLTYKILESHRLIYKLVYKPETGEVHYTFTTFRPSDTSYEVPCMSNCGMMMSREVYDMLGGWPSELGIYGGGEDFSNFCLSVLGMKKWIWPHGTLFHHGEKRGYHYLYDDYVRNKMIATYCFGGKELLDVFADHAKGTPKVLQEIKNDAIVKCKGHRELILSRQKVDIHEWAKRWAAP